MGTTRLIVLIGTGTSVGKTYVAERVLQAFAREGHLAEAYKPVESGIAGAGSPGADSDISRLRAAATFHVKPPLASSVFAAPVSPHLAARMEGRAVDLDAIRSEISRGRAAGNTVLIVELPGGAFSPLTPTVAAAAFARSLPDARVVLVASDRLGVLNDVGATTRACAAIGLPLFGIILSAAPQADASVGTNHVELPLVTRVPLLGRLPRTPAEAPLELGDPALDIARALLA